MANQRGGMLKSFSRDKYLLESMPYERRNKSFDLNPSRFDAKHEEPYDSLNKIDDTFEDFCDDFHLKEFRQVFDDAEKTQEKLRAKRKAQQKSNQNKEKLKQRLKELR